MKKITLTNATNEKTIIITIDEDQLTYNYVVITNNTKMYNSARDLYNLCDIMFNCYNDCTSREFDRYYFNNTNDHDRLKYYLDKMAFCKKWCAIYHDDLDTAKHYYRFCTTERVNDIINTNISVAGIKYHEFNNSTDICHSVKVEW